MKWAGLAGSVLTNPVNLGLQDPSPLEATRGEGKDKGQTKEGASQRGAARKDNRYGMLRC